MPPNLSSVSTISNHSHMAIPSVLPRIIPHILPLQEHMNLSEGGPGRLVPVPAFSHQVKDLPGAGVGLRQAHLSSVTTVEMTTVLYHLKVYMLYA